MDEFDLPAGRIVGRRTTSHDLADAAVLLDTIARLTTKLTPRGVWKFKTFEEADEWALSQIAHPPAPRA